MSGRPLRFLGGTIALWTLGRIAFLLPSEPDEVMAVVRAVASPVAPSPMVPSPVGAAHAMPAQAVPDNVAPPPSHLPARTVPIHAKAALAPLPLLPSRTEAAAPSAIVLTPPPVDDIPALPAVPSPPDRWSASIWAIWRDGGGGLLPGGQLGGTQAGLRLLRRLDRDGAVSASLRMSAPLRGLGREMALGIDWMPIRRIPLRLLVERRVALDKGEGGTAFLAIAGIGPRPIGPGLTVTAYAQGGAVLRSRGEPFVDGAARVGRMVTPDLDLGIGAWGGAQRDAARLDVGPTLGVAVPVAGRRIRLSLDWRQRIAGAAAPGSGPALSLAGDF